MKVKLRKVGNSYTVTVPRAIVEELALEAGGELDIELIAREDRIVLKPVKSSLNRLMEVMHAKAKERGVTEADLDQIMREIRGRK